MRAAFVARRSERKRRQKERRKKEEGEEKGKTAGRTRKENEKHEMRRRSRIPILKIKRRRRKPKSDKPLKMIGWPLCRDFNQAKKMSS